MSFVLHLTSPARPSITPVLGAKKDCSGLAPAGNKETRGCFISPLLLGWGVE